MNWEFYDVSVKKSDNNDPRIYQSSQFVTTFQIVPTSMLLHTLTLSLHY